MLLIRVRAGRRGGVWGAGGGGGAEPLGEGGGSVLVVPCGAGVSVMALLLRFFESESEAAETLAGSVADLGLLRGLRLLLSRCPVFRLPLKDKTSNLIPEILV
jgi:hypothetical protein